MKNNRTNGGTQNDLSKKLRKHQHLPIHVVLEYRANGETRRRPGSVLVQKSGHVDDDVRIAALDPFYEMDGRKKRHIGEVLEWYRGEDVGDLKRSEANELVENWTCLNAFEGKFWISDQKVVVDNQN